MMEKKTVFLEAEAQLKRNGFTITASDSERPWGGFFVIDEDHVQKFISHFFPDEDISQYTIAGKLSPKILVIAPGQRLSWQYHHRRAEIWKCINHDVAVITSDTDLEGEKQILHKDDTIKIQKGKRHRLIGLDTWGFVAEIWQHTDPAHPSNEDDIVRLQDDYRRV